MSESENARMAWPAESRLKTTQTTSARQPLGNVSPNIRQGLPAHVLANKPPMSGSPLKRSFTAAMADGPGFKYLKRRRLSDESPPSQASSPTTVHPSNLSAASSRNGTVTAAHSTVPEIQEPTPTEPGTPTGSVHEENPGSQESAAESRSFSSLINYDLSSQPNTASNTQQQQEPSQQETSGLLFKGPSLATLLRLRLQVAMYKVKTNQTDTPFNDLQVPEPSTLRISGNSWNSERSLFPKLLPAPILRPTPYSSRKIYDSMTSMHSSPPPAGSSERFGQASRSATPAKGTGPDEAELTSSIVKGRVAEGLLGLRNAL